MARVFVEPIGVTLDVGEDETLLQALQRAGIDIPHTCAGRGTCGKCIVRLGAGELSEPGEAENRRLSSSLRDEGWRLACMARPRGERVSIEVRQTGGRRQILATSALQHGSVRPAVKAVRIKMPPPTLTDARSDARRLSQALDDADVPFDVAQRFTEVARTSDWDVVAIMYGRRVAAVYPADAAPAPYGVAIDIGTSKIIAYLFDLELGRLVDHEALENPQMRFGEDVISRMAQAFDPAARAELAAAVRGGINACLERLYDRWALRAEQVFDMTVVANTAMHHLALGLSPVGLGASPFAPALAEPLTLCPSEMGLAMNAAGGVHFPPPIAGFVGSDALAVIAATRLASKKRPQMAIDIGTNTEIALVHDGKVSVTSCASGPAFEGYQIRHGMKAVAGAIERVRILDDGRAADVETIGGAPPLGICGSGVVDLLAGLVRAGVIGGSGRFADHPLVRRGETGAEYLVADGAHGEIVFTQQDVRALQLAKGAIHTGWELLLEKLAVDLDDLDRVYIAGAFGNYLDLDASQALGLFPPVARDRVAFVGNAAGIGAQMALVDVRARRHMARLREKTEFLDLATNPRFHEVFAGRLGFALPDLGRLDA
ncbi:MAG: ASKHA domain-containing protein [Thermoleophilia bacterium]